VKTKYSIDPTEAERGPGASRLTPYLGASERADNVIADFAEACDAQLERDHAALRAAVEEGRA
jgi:hypothetical protein